MTVPLVKLTKQTKDVIELLGDATGNTFSSKAKLILVTNLGTEDSGVFVRDGTNDVDVSTALTPQMSVTRSLIVLRPVVV